MKSSVNRIFVGLGGNLGSPPDTFRQALSLLSAHRELAVVACSSLYHSAPWGGVTQQPFTNAVVELSAGVDPHAMLDMLMAAEHALGRRRCRERRWGDRQLDLDLLAHGRYCVNRPGLCVPHRLLAQRRFVLEPWAEVAAEFVVPGAEIPVARLLQRCDDQGAVERLARRPED